MVVQKQVFISHADDQIGNAIQDAVRQAFAGNVRSFNTSRAARGLMSGLRIDEGLLDSLRASDLFLSIWTPAAVARPALMSWELGAAAATQRPVLAARALGVDIEQLPLGLGARFVNDLGDEESLARLVEDIAEILGVESEAGRTLTISPAPGYSVFYARRSPKPKLSISVHRKYLLLENVSRTELDDLRILYRGSNEFDGGVAAALDRALRKEGRVLSAGGRLVAALPSYEANGGQLLEVALRNKGDVVLQAEWKAPDIGREWTEVTIFGRDVGG